MKPIRLYIMGLCWLTVLMVLPGIRGALAENIDPLNNGSQYAYGENVGWLNAEPNGDGEDGVEVTDTELTGYIWGENIGWINLNPISYGGVSNDGDGTLSGYAWGENVGWINFDPTHGGVTIDTSGDFTGWAWGENIGWIHFKSDTPVAYKVQTEWSQAVNACHADIAPIPPEELDCRVNISDLVIMKNEFLRIDCNNPDPCYADIAPLPPEGPDNRVNISDLVIMKNEFLRIDCCP